MEWEAKEQILVCMDIGDEGEADERNLCGRKGIVHDGDPGVRKKMEYTRHKLGLPITKYQTKISWRMGFFTYLK